MKFEKPCSRSYKSITGGGIGIDSRTAWWLIDDLLPIEVIRKNYKNCDGWYESYPDFCAISQYGYTLILFQEKKEVMAILISGASKQEIEEYFSKNSLLTSNRFALPKSLIIKHEIDMDVNRYNEN